MENWIYWVAKQGLMKIKWFKTKKVENEKMIINV